MLAELLQNVVFPRSAFVSGLREVAVHFKDDAMTTVRSSAFLENCVLNRFIIRVTADSEYIALNQLYHIGYIKA